MKALFFQTKICEVSQIRINLNSLGLVVNKHCQRLKHTTKLGDANKLAFYFKIQFQYSRCGFRQFHRKQSTSFTCHIIDGNAVAVPNQVVGGRVSLLNKGNFCQCMVARFRAVTLRDKGRTAFQRPSLQSQSWFYFHLASGFCLGVIATFVWLLWDIETEQPGT